MFSVIIIRLFQRSGTGKGTFAMTSLLLVIIYLAFISLGLPDSLLGSAWPVMYTELGASVSWAGGLSMIISAGTIISSLSSDRLTRKFGTGKVTAVSVAMTAIALIGFSTSHSFWILCLWAIPYGLGAGSVDAALNNFVALHYPARHMSWLHCMWGVGASVGPVIMGWAITTGLRWNGGYMIIAVLQMALTAVLIFTLPLWKQAKSPYENMKPVSQASENPDAKPAPDKPLSLGQILKRRGIKEVLICFCCYSALESTTGLWAASYCTLWRGISAETAARWASLFYLGITIGRFICGFITMKVNDRNMIRLGQIVAAVGIVCVFLPGSDGLLLAGLILIGCGCAPIYPSIIHETPSNFGPELSQAIIGIQMAFAYTGSCLMPPLFGLIAQYISISLFPVFLVVFLVLMVIMAERLHMRVRS